VLRRQDYELWFVTAKALITGSNSSDALNLILRKVTLYSWVQNLGEEPFTKRQTSSTIFSYVTTYHLRLL